MSRDLDDLSKLNALLNECGKSNEPSYYEAACRLLDLSEIRLKDINIDFVDEGMLKRALIGNKEYFVNDLASTGSLRDFVSLDFAEELVSIDAEYFALSDRYKDVSDSAYLSGARKNPDSMLDLDYLRRHLLIRLVGEGLWPTSREFSDIPRPVDADEAISRLLRSKRDKQNILLRAYILSRPVDELLSLMNTHARKNLMIKLLPAEELKKHIQKNGIKDKRFVGEVFESSLGL